MYRSTIQLVSEGERRYCFYCKSDK